MSQHDILQTLLVADPANDTRTLMTEQCATLADHIVVAQNGSEVLHLVAQEKPDMVLLSLEINNDDATQVAKKIHKLDPNLFIIGCYRELAVGMLDKMGKFGFAEMISHPIDYALLFRLCSERFNTVFRRHTRFHSALPVWRADGVLLGNTIDISEGGLLMQCSAEVPAAAGHSMLIDVELIEGQDKLRVRGEFLPVQILKGTEGRGLSDTARVQFKNLRGDEYRRLLHFLASLAHQ